MNEEVIVTEKDCDLFKLQTNIEEHGFIKNDWCIDNHCECSDIDFDECPIKARIVLEQKNKLIKEYEAKFVEFEEKFTNLELENRELKKRFNINEQECWDIAFMEHDLATAEAKLKQVEEIADVMANANCNYVKEANKILEIIGDKDV